MGIFDFLTTSKDKTDTQGREFGSEGTRATRDSNARADERSSKVNSFNEDLNKVVSGFRRQGSDDQRAELENFISGGATYLSEKFDKSAAIKDAQVGVQAVVAQILEAGLPDIRSGASSAGGYNSTSRQLLTDNLVAQAAVKGGEVIQNTIKDYADIQLRGTEVLSELTNLLFQSDVSTDEAEEGSRQGSEEEEGTGSKIVKEVTSTDSVTEFDNTSIGRTTARNRDSGLKMLNDAASSGVAALLGL